MPTWFIDIESATEMEAKSNGTPPAARTPAHAARASSPSSALHGVTRPSVEATPTNGFSRSASDMPSARRNARCGARSSPSTVMREGSFFVFTHDFFDGSAAREAERLRAAGKRRLGHAVHDGLQPRVALEAHPAARAVLDRVPHLGRRHRNAGQQHRALETERSGGNLRRVTERLHHAAE